MRSDINKYANDHQRWKHGWQKHLADCQFTHAVNLAWNRSVGSARAKADLRDLLYRVDRKLIGPRFNKFPSAARTNALFVFEGYGHDHVHVHSLWRAPAQPRAALEDLFPGQRGGVWNELVRSGSYVVEQFNPENNGATFINYALKEQHRSSEADLMLWSEEFHPTR